MTWGSDVQTMTSCWVIRTRNGVRAGQEFVYWNPNEGWVYDPMLATRYADEKSAQSSIENYASSGLWSVENVSAVQIFTT